MSKESNIQLLCQGEILSTGIAEGTLCFVDIDRGSASDGVETTAENTLEEIRRFETQVGAVIGELETLANSLEEDSYFEESEITKTHILLLNDPGFHQKVKTSISQNRVRAEIAVEYVLKETIELLENSESAIAAEKSADIQDILLRLRVKLRMEDNIALEHTVMHIDNPVAYMRELLPFFVIEAKKQGVSAIVVEHGTSLSHAAIMARSFNIPVLRIDKRPGMKLEPGINVLVDALNGSLVVNPSADYTQKVQKSELTGPLFEEASLPVSIWLNLSDPEQMTGVNWRAVKGIGLFRSELIFMRHLSHFPSEDEQYRLYTHLIQNSPDRPVTIRTLDIGGDKVLPYFSLGPQENPYLGLRGNRVFRFHPEIFIVQMKAILRSAVHTKNLRVLFPLVENVDDLLNIFSLIDDAIDALEKENKHFTAKIKRGVLVEVPSAVWNLEHLLHHVDFVSIGTNDLLQYFFAVDRNNANVKSSYRPENPGALRMLKYVVDTAKEHEKQLTLCGEIATDTFLLPLLIGLGFEHFSMDPQAIRLLTPLLSKIDERKCRQIADECLAAATSSEVREIMENSGIYEKKHPAKTVDISGRENVDPVCKMVVQTTGNELNLLSDGRRYFFCSQHCRDQFIQRQA